MPDLFGSSTRTAWLTELLHDAAASPRLTPWEERFIRDTQRRLDTYGENTQLTPAQMETLKRIEGKIYAVG